MRFLLIIPAMLILNLIWWRRADQRLRPLRRAQAWRLVLGAFMAMQVLYLLWTMAIPSWSRATSQWMPVPLLAVIYIWNMLLLPLSFTVVLLVYIGGGIRAAVRRLLHRHAGAKAQEPAGAAEAGTLLSRRQVLAAGAMAVPPLLTLAVTGKSLGQLGHFRINPMHLVIPQLPPALEGLTIAHLSDVHIGRFTRSSVLPRIVEATNNLRADLVLFTGDLLDLSLADLDAGLEMIRRMEGRYGLIMCEGNHDLFENPIQFEQRVRQAGVPLLVNESKVIPIRGVDVQLLGLRWDHGNAGRGDPAIRTSVAQLLLQRLEHAFPILLAHHPHAFDPAAAAGLPLTLSGHTHGGQFMLSERLGAGPMFFRYWSGRYSHKDCTLVVSNGVGNWFPLRTYAPAEIGYLTLHSGRA